MHRTLTIFSWLAAVVSALGATGCSSSSHAQPPNNGACDTTTPVSFSKDVIPVFQSGCALTMVCHGQMNNSAEESLYLGENTMSTAMTDPNVLHGMLVGVPSKEDPLMNIVTKGDLDNSFLWQKVAVIGAPNVTLSASLATGCGMAATPCSPTCNSTTPCGASMPYQNLPLDSARSCTIQSWISQGAQNN